MNIPDEKKQRQFDAFRRIIMPILGVGEAVATQGKSPGTTALAVEQNYQDAEDRQNQFRRQAEADALQRRLTNAQLEGSGREKAKYEAEEGRRAEWEEGVSRIPGLSEIERLTLRGAGPQEGIRYLIEKGKPDIAESALLLRQQGQSDLLKQRQEFEKNNPKPIPQPKPTPKKPLRESEKKLYQGLQLAEKAAKIMDKYGDELTVGPVKGGVMKMFAGKIPETPINTEFRSAIASARGAMFSYLIGAGQTESEAKRLVDAYFDINQDKEVVRGKINNAIQFFQSGLPQDFDFESSAPLPIQSKIPQPGKESPGESSENQQPSGSPKFTIKAVKKAD